MNQVGTVYGNSTIQRTFDSILHFFLKPASPKPLAIFRIAFSFILIAQAFSMRESILSFLSNHGLVQQDVVNMLSDPFLPKLNGLMNRASQFGISESGYLHAFSMAYMLSLFCLLLGIFTNLAALLTWLLHWTIINTGYSGSYGADMYAHIFLFYLVWVPSGASYSLDRVFRRVSDAPSSRARLGLRAMQLHLCISYLASGLEKGTGIQWWNGEAIWMALNLPEYCPFDMHWLANFPFVAMVVGWATLAVETLYCIFVWHRKTRLLWVLATCGLHVSIAILLSLPIFSLIMCVATLACFGISAKGATPRQAEGSPA